MNKRTGFKAKNCAWVCMKCGTEPMFSKPPEPWGSNMADAFCPNEICPGGVFMPKPRYDEHAPLCLGNPSPEEKLTDEIATAHEEERCEEYHNCHLCQEMEDKITDYIQTLSIDRLRRIRDLIDNKLTKVVLVDCRNCSFRVRVARDSAEEVRTGHNRLFSHHKVEIVIPYQ